MSIVVDKEAGPVPEVHLRSTKRRSADDPPLAHGGLDFGIDVDGLRVPGDGFVGLPFEDLEGSEGLFLGPDDGGAWQLDGLHLFIKKVPHRGTRIFNYLRNHLNNFNL